MPVLLLILACALWGGSFPLIKALGMEQQARLPEASATFLAVWLQSARFAIAALLLAPFVLHRRVTLSELRQGAWLALWGGVGMALQAWGLGHTHASTCAFLTQAYCIFLPLIACIKSRRPPDRKTVLATVLVVTGVAILSGMQPGDLRIGKGEAATLAAAVSFTIQILTLENPKYAGNRGLPVTLAMSACIAAIFLPVGLMLAPEPSLIIRAGASAPAFGIVFALALFCSVGAYGLMNCWQPRVSATEAGLIYTTEPVFTAGFTLFLPAMLGAAIGAVYANESLTVALIAGGSLIVIANIMMQWKRAAPQTKSP